MVKYIDDEFGITVEYWSGDDNSAKAYWNPGTDWKFGGPAKPGYFIEIVSHGWNSKDIHDWIRLVRPFKGPYGPGNVVQFWQTGMTGQEEEIIDEVKNIIRSGGPGAEFERGRHDIRARPKSMKEMYRTSKKVEADETLHEDLRKERQKIRARKAAPKKAIAIVCVVAMIAGVFVFGNGEISLPDIPVLLPDLPELIPNFTQSCEVHNSIRITTGEVQGKISLMSCPIKNKEMFTVSGELNQSSQINLTLLSPDMKKIQDVTFVKEKFSHIIGKELYSKDVGMWRINVIVDEKPQGALKFMVE